MRYSLAILVLATAIVPPTLALIWLLAPSDFMQKLADRCIWPGMLVAVVLIGFTCFSIPDKETRPPRRPWIAAIVLWSGESLSLWHWIRLIIALGGWMLLWGDRGPPFSDLSLHVFAAGLAI